ncbi:MAG: tetratricopeptide repeat protein [Phormidesmis sp.]
MTQDSNNRFAAIALLLTSGIIITVSVGILFLLDGGLTTVAQESAEESVSPSAREKVEESAPSLGDRFRSVFTRACEKDVNSLEAATYFLETCDRPDNVIALKNQGRALLISWDLQWSKSEKAERLEQVAESFSQASELAPDDPELAFYNAFTQDFEAFVLAEELSDCVPASDRYAEAIQLYDQIDEINPEDHNLSIVNELGHFLTNRDRDYATAITLYDKASVDHPQLSDVLMSKATAQLLEKDFFGAKESFEKVLEIDPNTYQVKYGLGSLWAQLENYEQALKYYEDITTNPDTANFYYAWRDQGIANYFLGNNEKAQQSFEKALEFEEAAFFDEKNYSFIENVSDCLAFSEGGENCLGASPGLVKANLKDNGIFQGSVIVHRSSEDSDPFFEVEHDAFYRCNQT